MITARRDLTGQVFGLLTVVGRAADYVKPDGSARTSWRCRCECGGEVSPVVSDLTSGNTRSCGCLRVVVGRRYGGQNRVDSPSYKTAHGRVRRTRGSASASLHVCVDCGSQARDWSYDHTDPDELTGPIPAVRGRAPVICAYSAKPEHYSPRCKPCHLKFDRGRT